MVLTCLGSIDDSLSIEKQNQLCCIACRKSLTVMFKSNELAFQRKDKSSLHFVLSYYVFCSKRKVKRDTLIIKLFCIFSSEGNSIGMLYLHVGMNLECVSRYQQDDSDIRIGLTE